MMHKKQIFLFKAPTLSKVFCSIGNCLEWFDFALYGFFGAVFAHNFFPPQSENLVTKVISSYLIFAIGFFARPLGGVIFGYIGDHYGRLWALRITSIGLTLVTFLMSILPTYENIGYIATIMLILMRICQGVFIGGEYGGNIVYLYESSNKKYFWGSIASCSGGIGILIASGVSALIFKIFSQNEVYIFGWRIAFFCCIPLGAATIITRFIISENTQLKKVPVESVYKIWKNILFKHNIQLLIAGGILCLHATTFYFIFIFVPIFLSILRHIADKIVLLNNTILLVFQILLIPCFGILADKINGLRLLLIVSVLFIILSFPVFCLIAYGNMFLVNLGIVIFAILSSVNAAIIPTILPQIFLPNIRYSAVALILNLGFGIFGGMITSVSLFSIKETNILTLPAIYLMLSGIITLASTIVYCKLQCKSSNN